MEKHEGNASHEIGDHIGDTISHRTLKLCFFFNLHNRVDVGLR
jgi:hypothetical protein